MTASLLKVSKLTQIVVNIDLAAPLRAITQHTFSLLENHFELQCTYRQDSADLIIAEEGQGDIGLSKKFIDAYQKKSFEHEDLFVDQPLLFFQDGNPDYLGTCIYMVNYLQELVGDRHFDELDRFKYESSYQYKFNCAEENLVLQYLIKLVESTSKLHHLKRKQNPSLLFVSHDIDILFKSAWPELKTTLKHFKIRQFWQILSSDHSLNWDTKIFQKMHNIHQGSGIKSTFFWLVNNKPFVTRSGERIENANYTLEEANTHITQLRKLRQNIGVHWSLGAKRLSEEKRALDPNISINRNHYLHSKLPDTWLACERASIGIDCTAGFAEHIGFRNSYGLPVQPFSPILDRVYEVYEVPLHIMDATLMRNEGSAHHAKSTVIRFLDKHRHDCIISLLWHNNYFSEIKYGAWASIYEDILKAAHQLGLKNYDPVQPALYTQ